MGNREEFELWYTGFLVTNQRAPHFIEAYDSRQPEIDALKAEVGRRRKDAEGMSYGIIDPDYARIYSKVRCTAWVYGYAAMMHGSFTRDLDLLLVPWTDSVSPALEQKHLITLICDRCDLRENGHQPSVKPHGRTVYTLMFQTFGDPRFIDIGFMPAIDAAMKETK